jgi:DNA invertase Pin-like site-specific DNA recombinase
MTGATRRAAQYVRMSTDHQRYSLEFQGATNAAYALERGLEVVRTYADAGVSGLTLKRRAGLKSLLADVVGGHADFDTVLVYDVSRWGRFQDPDQAAHYEFICREAGVQIVYTAEPFTNDGTLASTLVKHLKRAMAAEHLRELSAKVSGAQRGLRAQGYWMGGQAGFGLRRQLVAPDGTLGMVLEYHQHKALQGHRCVLTPGPPHEVSTVRRMFKWYVDDDLSIAEIAARLNRGRVPPENGLDWNGPRVRQVLGSEKYIGTLVAGRQVYFLKKPERRPRSEWTRLRNAVKPIVSQALFSAAQAKLHPKKAWVDDEALVRELRGALRRHGRLSRLIINKDPAVHCADVFVRRFGGLLNAYERVGYVPEPHQKRAAEIAERHQPWRHATYRGVPSDADLLQRLRDLLDVTGKLTVALIRDTPGMPCAQLYSDRFGGMRRVYALVGYEPSEWQECIMGVRTGQTIDRATADALRAETLARRAAEVHS